jgi:uncharacterized protein (TIGR02246 family)
MHDDERTIRGLLDAWWRATKAGDADGVLDLMADDVVFLTPGGELRQSRVRQRDEAC